MEVATISKWSCGVGSRVAGGIQKNAPMLQTEGIFKCCRGGEPTNIPRVRWYLYARAAGRGHLQVLEW